MTRAPDIEFILSNADRLITVTFRCVASFGLGDGLNDILLTQLTSEDPMTKSKSKPKASTRSAARTTSKSKPRSRSTHSSPKTSTRPDTKHARILTMLRTPSRCYNCCDHDGHRMAAALRARFSRRCSPQETRFESCKPSAFIHTGLTRARGSMFTHFTPADLVAILNIPRLQTLPNSFKILREYRLSVVALVFSR